MKRRRADYLTDPARLAAVRASGLLGLVRARLQALTVQARFQLDADAAQVNVVDGELLHHAAASPPASAPTPTDPAETSGCRVVVEVGDVVAVDDTATDAAWCDLPWAGTWRGYLGAPVRYDGETVGSFCVLTRQPREWTDQDREALRALAVRALTSTST